MSGIARAHLRDPGAPDAAEIIGAAAVGALQDYADDARRVARVAEALQRGGWEIKLLRLIGYSVHATFEGSYDEAVRSAVALMSPGEAVYWSANGLALGGFIVGQDPAAFGPGSPLPLLVINHLTGRQERVEDEAELRGAVARAIGDCAEWWEAHPEEAPDGNASAIAAAIGAERDELSLGDAPIPAHWSYRAATAPLGPESIVSLVTESHLRWEGAQRVFDWAAVDDPRVWAIEDQVIATGHYEGLAREVFAAGAREAAALLRA